MAIVSERAPTSEEEAKERGEGGRRGKDAPVRIPGHAEGVDARVGEERPEEVCGEEEVRARPGDEAIEFGRAGARGGRRGRERRHGRCGLLQRGLSSTRSRGGRGGSGGGPGIWRTIRTG